MPERKTLSLYNTLTRRVEPVAPLEPGKIRFYSCGPTVYSHAHIGNFRSFLTADLIVRTAAAAGYETRYVTNVTDVGHLTEDDVADAGGEDRMAKALRTAEGKRFANVFDLARYYTETLLNDWRALNLREPDVRPRATEHVSDQIQAVEALLAAGYAYETEQGIYFSVSRFPEYGRLSGNVDAAGLESASRELVTDPEKRDPRDFALWKKDPKHLMQWYSPWGWGFPGWHIECSVMSARYLGEEIDIHAGGEDLIFPHHDCEIAQAESLSGKRFARHWVHTRFLQVEGEKMAKRFKNYFTVRDLIDPESQGGRGFDPLAVRLALISGHYRKPFNFTMDTLRTSARHVQRLQEVKLAIAAGVERDGTADETLSVKLDALYDRTLDALCNDLNTPEALAAVFEGVRVIQTMKEGLERVSAQHADTWLARMNALLGIVAHEAEVAPTSKDEDVEAEIDALVAERQAARSRRDFVRADAIRDQLAEMGIEVMDGRDGVRWRKKV